MSGKVRFEDMTSEDADKAVHAAQEKVYLLVEHREGTLIFEPVYVHPESGGLAGYMSGDHYGHKLDLSSLQFTAHMWDYGMGGGITRYTSRSWIDLSDSEVMTKTLRLIRNRMEKAYQKFSGIGDPDLTQYVLAISKAINVVGGVIDGETYHNFGEFLVAMIRLGEHITASLKEEAVEVEA